jgi:hypothetical protein
MKEAVCITVFESDTGYRFPAHHTNNFSHRRHHFPPLLGVSLLQNTSFLENVESPSLLGSFL